MSPAAVVACVALSAFLGALVGGWRRKTPPKSVLRDLVDPAVFKVDPTLALYDAALLVRRAGLEHMVETAFLSEILVLAKAGEQLADERSLLVAMKLRDPAAALAPYDGGEALYQETLEFARRAGR